MVQKMSLKSSHPIRRWMDFDPADRKFIAVALAHPEKPPILQAVDSQWWDFRDAFRRNGVIVEFICEDESGGLLNTSVAFLIRFPVYPPI